jgi:uncharacterized protein
MGGIETLLMMTQHNSDAVLGPGVHMRAAVALIRFVGSTTEDVRRSRKGHRRRRHSVQGADFRDLVDAPIRIMVGTADDSGC